MYKSKLPGSLVWLGLQKKPEHESIVLVTAKAHAFKQYVYKLYSNVEEISFPVNWQSAAAINHEIRSLSNKLPQFGHAYTYEGDQLLEAAFGLEHKQRQQFTDLKPFYKEGTLVIHNGKVGSIGKPDTDFNQATFQPFLSGQHQKDLYENYITIRDSYLELAEKESAEDVEYAGLRKILQDSYEKFIDQYGLLNYPSNRKLISNDSSIWIYHSFFFGKKRGRTIRSGRYNYKDTPSKRRTISY